MQLARGRAMDQNEESWLPRLGGHSRFYILKSWYGHVWSVDVY